ncbi:MAG: HEAT repeat domain-containing protein [Myxococcota bacterium]
MSVDFRAERDLALLTLEREKSAPVRAEAAETLCELAVESPRELRVEFVPAVARLIADSQVEVRCAGLALAAEVLPMGEAVDILTRHAADQEQRVRVEAVGRIADLAQSDLRGVLAAALEDEALPVRFEAARGMVALKHSAGLEVLLEALDDRDLRFRAAAALARLGNKDAVPRLKKAFHAWLLPAFDRTQLAGALAVLGEAEGVAHLFKRAAKKWSMDRAMAVELLGEVKAGGAKERLLQILRDPKDEARGAAARGLGRLGDRSLEPVLLAALDDSTLTDDLRLDLAEALLLLGGEAGRARAMSLRLEDAEARAELQAMLAETAAP